MAVATSALALPKADLQGIRLLTVAHLVNDANQSALPAIIPWLVTHRGLSLAAAATLVLAMNLSSSVVQPLFGHLSDRRSLAWVIPIALLLACFGTALIGVASSLPLMLVGAFISGIGVAAFHPEGSRFTNYFSGSRRATGMSWFSLGGYLGFALGPIVITPLILIFGLPGTAVLMIPGVVLAYLVWRELPRFEEVRRLVHHAHRARHGRDDWRAFSILTGVIALRSTTFFAGVTFLPIFAISVLHVGAALGSAALAAMLVGGAFATLYGGHLADRFDRRRIVSLSLVLTTIFAGAIAIAGAHHVSYAFFVPLGVCLGIGLGLSASVLVVIGQEYLPERIGIASGVTLGLSVTIGGIAAPLFGAIGGHYGLVMVFFAIVFFGALSLLGSLFLPRLAHVSPGKPIAASAL